MKTALYTTLYPGCERFFEAFQDSVLAQTHRAFDIVLGIDQLDLESLPFRLDRSFTVTQVRAGEGENGYRVRGRAVEHMVRRYDAIVLADADDVLHPERVEAAVAALADHDLHCCNMDLIDEEGKDLGWTFFPEPPRLPNLLEANCFGFSNTAYRSETLKAGLPIPKDLVTLDWWFAAAAGLSPEKVLLDPRPLMRYRQYPGNSAKVLPPFTERDILKGLAMKEKFLDCVAGNPASFSKAFMTRVHQARFSLRSFKRELLASPAEMRRFVRRVNAHPSPWLWWEYIPVGQEAVA